MSERSTSELRPAPSTSREHISLHTLKSSAFHELQIYFIYVFVIFGHAIHKLLDSLAECLFTNVLHRITVINFFLLSVLLNKTFPSLCKRCSRHLVMCITSDHIRAAMPLWSWTEPAKTGTCARDRRALQQLALNVHVKHSDLT